MAEPVPPPMDGVSEAAAATPRGVMLLGENKYVHQVLDSGKGVEFVCFHCLLVLFRDVDCSRRGRNCVLLLLCW
ncbi:hypothetical protein ABZP36_028964 [Zizania latifolia]